MNNGPAGGDPTERCEQDLSAGECDKRGGENNFDDLLKKAEEELYGKVPPKTGVEPPPNDPSKNNSDETVNSKIAEANAKARNFLDDAKYAIISAYTDNEKNRADRQKPLLNVVCWFTGLQLFVFNLVIAGAIVFIFFFKSKNQCLASQVFDILKYYIGATVVELIGMLIFITKGTFSDNHAKIMKDLLKSDTSEKDKK